MQFVDNHHGHITTGNLDIIRDSKLKIKKIKEKICVSIKLNDIFKQKIGDLDQQIANLEKEKHEITLKIQQKKQALTQWITIYEFYE